MLSSVLSLGLALTLATAAPTARQTPIYPPTSSSNAFHLIANVTDPSHPFGATINTWAVTSYHTGAGFATAVLTPTSTGRTFYVNGTASQVQFGETSILTDGGTPPFPDGWTVQNATQFDPNYPAEHTVYINAGAGTPNIGLHRFPDPIPDVYGTSSGTYVACNNTIPYTGAQVVTIQYAYATFINASGAFDYEKNIPQGCVEIALLPQCTPINTLPPGSLSSHAFAVEVDCYADVAGIDWTVYSAW